MVRRMGGSRHKTRYKLQRAAGEHGKLRLTARLAQFKEGEQVALIIDSSESKGMFFPRHHGKTGLRDVRKSDLADGKGKEIK